MTRTSKLVFPLILFVLSALCTGCGGPSKEEFEAVQSTIARLESKLSELESKNTELEDKATDLEQKVDDLEAEMSEVTDKLHL